MAIVKISFDLQGEKQYERGFQAMARESGDLSSPLGRIRDLIRRWIGEQFLSEGSAKMGAPWAPLSPAYAEWKDVHYPSMPILVATGDMRAAMLSPNAFDVGKRRLVYEPASDIAAFHQFGTEHMPARKMVVFTTADKRTMDRQFVEWFHYLKTRHLGLGTHGLAKH